MHSHINCVSERKITNIAGQRAARFPATPSSASRDVLWTLPHVSSSSEQTCLRTKLPETMVTIVVATTSPPHPHRVSFPHVHAASASPPKIPGTGKSTIGLTVRCYTVSRGANLTSVARPSVVALVHVASETLRFSDVGGSCDFPRFPCSRTTPRKISGFDECTNDNFQRTC